MESVELVELLCGDLIDRALREDLGSGGDRTGLALVPDGLVAGGGIVARREGIVAGLAVAEAVLRRLDRELRFGLRVRDGERVAAGTVLAEVEGRARALLAGERVALNFLAHLSGIATATADLARRIAHTRARITCTRKTTPGLRALEKYAVRTGGGVNHRFDLTQALLVKDNHIALAGSVKRAVELARRAAGHVSVVEVEVDTLEQLEEALEAGADVILLDNMDPATLREAVRRTAGRAILEASGGIRPETVVEVAESGVDYISVGWITHSAPALDVALDLEPVRP